MDALLQKWGLINLTIKPIESTWKSSWDIGGKYVLKRIHETKQFERSVQLSNLLIAEEIPVAVFIPATDGQIAVTYEETQYCLTTKLPGNHIDLYERPTLAIEMGREIARLHKALVRIEPQVSCEETDLLSNWLNYIKPKLGDDVPAEKIENTEKQIFEFHTKLPRHLIHRDVHLKNVMFDNGRLTGWLDFDLCCRHVRLFDIAYLLSGLSCEIEQDIGKSNIWQLIRDDLLKGYNEINTLFTDEYAALPMLLTVIELLFVAFYKN
jgi:Ser/Thr protein kinase RdoA (MazF antagonist)